MNKKNIVHIIYRLDKYIISAEIAETASFAMFCNEQISWNNTETFCVKQWKKWENDGKEKIAISLNYNKMQINEKYTLPSVNQRVAD